MSAEEEPQLFSDIPPRLALVGIAVGGAVYFIFQALGNPQAGRIAGFSAFVLVGVVANCRPLWKERWFWIVFLGIAILHLTIILLAHWPDVHYPALMIAPFAFIDFFVIVKLIELVGRHFWRGEPPDISENS